MKKKTIIAVVILSVVAVGIFYFLIMGNIGRKYNTVQVEKGEIEKFVQESGTISSKNIRKYYGNNIRKVENIDLELGDYVKKGQILIKFEDEIDLEIQKTKKQIEVLRADYNEELSGADSESINNAKVEIEKIKSSINLEDENRRRIQELYENGAVAKTELEEIEYKLDQLEKDLSIAENNYNQIKKGISKNIKAKNEAEIDLLLLNLKDLEGDRKNSVIYADFDGVITELNTFEGDIPSAGLMILEILDPLEKIIVVDFMVEDALNIKPGMRAEVNDKDLGIQIKDIKVQKIHPKSFTTYSELGVEENRHKVEINLPESSRELPFGLKIETKVMIEEPREALFIPEAAIYEKDLKKYVHVLEEGKAIEREIETGIENNNQIEIREGLKEGEKVILHYEEN